jgi:hypothetical protein
VEKDEDIDTRRPKRHKKTYTQDRSGKEETSGEEDAVEETLTAQHHPEKGTRTSTGCDGEDDEDNTNLNVCTTPGDCTEDSVGPNIRQRFLASWLNQLAGSSNKELTWTVVHQQVSKLLQDEQMWRKNKQVDDLMDQVRTLKHETSELAAMLKTLQTKPGTGTKKSWMGDPDIQGYVAQEDKSVRV